MITCSKCGRVITAEEAVILPVSDPNLPNRILCPACAELVGQQSGRPEQSFLKRGLVFCLFGAAIGIFVWDIIFRFTGNDLSIFALIIGWLTAQFFVWGSHGLRNPAGRFACGAITLTAILIHQYLKVSYQILTALIREHYHNLPGLIPLKMAVIQTENQLKTDPFTLLIWLMGIWVAWFWVSKKRLSDE